MSESPLPNIFLTTFSILYGIMLNTSFELALFHFGWLFKDEEKYPKIRKQDKVGRRILFSFFLFNLCPFLYFGWIYNLLRKTSIPPYNIWQICGVFLLSLFVFFFYRLYHLFLVNEWFRKGIYDLDHCALRDFKNNRLQTMGLSFIGQSIAVIFYVLLAYLGWWFINNPNFIDIFIKLRARARIFL